MVSFEAPGPGTVRRSRRETGRPVGVGDTEPGNPPSRAPILNDHGLMAATEDPLVGPLAERRQHRQQRLALVGQAVLEAMTLAADVHALEDAVIDQMLEPGGQDVLRDAEAALEVPEAAGAEEGVAHDEQGPPVSQGLEGLADPAVHLGEARPPHGPTIAQGIWLHQATKSSTAVRYGGTAMTEKPAASETEWKSTACILCECNCGIEVQLGGPDGRRLVRVRGDDAHPASKGYACEKPLRLDFYQNGPHRLTKPLRRRSDGTFEEIDWDTAIREVAARFAAIRDTHGGESIFYYGGGGQGNHLPGAYGRSTRAVLGSIHRSSALAQEKTGEFWVADKMVGGYTRADFEHCEVALFLGKNPWFSHSIPRARVTLREISKDPDRCLIVVDPRRTETAEIADIHLQVKPGTDAWLLAALVGVLVQENLLARDWIDRHADGLEQVLPHFAELSVADYCAACGVPEELVRTTARRIAAASSLATFEDLGVQMNRHSTLVSYLHKLLVFLTGNFGKEGAAYLPTAFVPLAVGKEGGGGAPPRTPVTGARVIGGLTPCNVIPDEILDGSPEALPGDAGRERQPRTLARRQPAHARGDRGPRPGGGDRRRVHGDRAARPLRPAGREPVREGRGHLLQLRVSAQLLPSPEGAHGAAAGPVLRGRAPRAAPGGPRCAAGGCRRDAARRLARGTAGVSRAVLHARRREPEPARGRAGAALPCDR